MIHDSLVKRSILQIAHEAVVAGKPRVGCILNEAPPFASVDELVTDASDKARWGRQIQSLCPEVKKFKQRKSKRTQSYNVKIRFTNHKG